MPTVYAVVGDIGSAKEIYAGIKALPSGIEVRWFVNPSVKAKAGTEFLAKLETPVFYDTRGPREDDKPDLIVMGACSTACESQVAWTKWGLGRYPVVWVEDLWGTGQVAGALSVKPDEMLVVDEVAVKMAQMIRPDLKATIVGKPTFGALPDASRQAEIRERVRNSFIDNDEFLLTIQFGADPAERALAQLPEIVGLLRPLPVVVAFRFHSKQPQKDMLWAAACESGLDTIDAREVDLNQLNIASNMVVADWGGMDAYKALLCGIPTATLLFPEQFALESGEVFDDYQRRVNVGFPEGTPPIIGTSPWWGVSSPQQLASVIKYVIRYEVQMRRRTIERALPFRDLVRPGAAERMAHEFMKYIC